MPIDPNFPKKLQPMGKHGLEDGEHFHIVWGPGTLADAAQNEEVKKAYAERGEEIVPLGIHGTMVAVDWDTCIADGACLDACPVQVFEWYRTAVDVSAKDVLTTKSPGNGADKKDGRADYTDKSDPIREYQCIWCLACENVCPTLSIKVNQENSEVHEKVASTL